MKKILIFAIALVASVVAFTSCEKGNEPELKGTVYHYHGISDVRKDKKYEHDLLIALENGGKMTMKWVGVKESKDAEPVNLYLYNGTWRKENGKFHISCNGKPQLPNGKPYNKWQSFDVDGRCDKNSCDFDYHINGSTAAIFTGKIVKD